MHRFGPFFILFVFCSASAGAQRLTPPVKDSMRFSKTALPLQFYAQHLGFFCRQELRLQKAASVNVFFRLGSKDYVDYLEQKPNARRF